MLKKNLSVCVAKIISHISSPHCTLGNISADRKPMCAEKRKHSTRSQKPRGLEATWQSCCLEAAEYNCGYQVTTSIGETMLRSPWELPKHHLGCLPGTMTQTTSPHAKTAAIACGFLPRSYFWPLTPPRTSRILLHLKALHILRGFLSTKM